MARKNKKRGPSGHPKAQLRFAVIGGLLSSPPHPGASGGIRMGHKSRYSGGHGPDSPLPVSFPILPQEVNIS